MIVQTNWFEGKHGCLDTFHSLLTFFNHHPNNFISYEFQTENKELTITTWVRVDLLNIGFIYIALIWRTLQVLEYAFRSSGVGATLPWSGALLADPHVLLLRWNVSSIRRTDWQMDSQQAGTEQTYKRNASIKNKKDTYLFLKQHGGYQQRAVSPSSITVLYFGMGHTPSPTSWAKQKVIQ